MEKQNNPAQLRYLEEMTIMDIPCDVYFTIEAKIARFLDCSLKPVSVGG